MIFLAVACPTPGKFSSSAALAELTSTFAAAGAAAFGVWASTSTAAADKNPNDRAAMKVRAVRRTLSLAMDSLLSHWQSAGPAVLPGLPIPDRVRSQDTVALRGLQVPQVFHVATGRLTTEQGLD